MDVFLILKDISDLTLVFKNDDLETEYSLNLEPTTNKTIFKTNTLINEGINLEELKQGEYLLLLKSKKNDKVIYYNLINDTKYKNLEYYTITKAGKNNKIDISFANNLNKNLFLSCKEVTEVKMLEQVKMVISKAKLI